MAPRTRSRTVIDPSRGIRKRITCFSPAATRRADSAGSRRRQVPSYIVGSRCACASLRIASSRSGGAEAGVGVAALDEPPRVLAVDLGALRLAVGAVGAADVGPLVPLQPEPAQARHQLLLGAGDEALAVGVLDAQDELPARLAGDQVVVERGAPAPEVRVPRRARGKAHAHRRRHGLAHRPPYFAAGEFACWPSSRAALSRSVPPPACPRSSSIERRMSSAFGSFGATRR